MKHFKNLAKLFAVGSVLSTVGCISKQPAFTRSENIEKNSDGTCTTNEFVQCVGTKTEFTELGTIWNTATYGTLGIPYGLIQGAFWGYQDTNHTSVVTKSLNATYEGIKGVGIGCYEGLSYGANLKYAEGRSVEGHIFDLVEDTANCLFRLMENSR